MEPPGRVPDTRQQHPKPLEPSSSDQRTIEGKQITGHSSIPGSAATSMHLRSIANLKDQEIKQLLNRLPPYQHTSTYRQQDISVLRQIESQVSSVLTGSRPVARVETGKEAALWLKVLEQLEGIDVTVLLHPITQEPIILLARKNAEGQDRKDRLMELEESSWQIAQREINQGVPAPIALQQAELFILDKRMMCEFLSEKQIIPAQERAFNQLLELHNQHPDYPLNFQPSATHDRNEKRLYDAFLLQHLLKGKAPMIAGDRWSGTPNPAEGSKLAHIQRRSIIYDQKLDTPLPSNKKALQENAESIQRELSELLLALQKVCNKQPDNFHFDEWLFIWQQKQLLENDYPLIEEILQDPNAFFMEGQLTWREALEFKRAGYPLIPGFTQLKTDLTDDQVDLNTPIVKLGGSDEGPIWKLAFNTGSAQQHKVFKAETGIDSTLWQSIISEQNYFDPLYPLMTARNIATWQIAKKLGMAELVPECQFAMHNGQLGMMTDFIEGEPGNKWIEKGSQGKKQRKTLAREQLIEGHCPVHLASQIKMQLCDLETLDALLGQPDRHGANIIINYQTGKVTAIDNDICLCPSDKNRGQKFAAQ